MLLAATTQAQTPEIICTLLLISVIVLFIAGLCQAIGLAHLAASRYSILIAAVIALVLYIVLC